MTALSSFAKLAFEMRSQRPDDAKPRQDAEACVTAIWMVGINPCRRVDVKCTLPRVVIPAKAGVALSWRHLMLTHESATTCFAAEMRFRPSPE